MNLHELQPRKILVRGVNWLGDAVMTAPAMVRLRERFPEAHITMLTRNHLAGIWQGHSATDEVIPIAHREGAWSLGRRLKKLSFDLGIALPNSFRTGLELRLAGIPVRIGYRGRGRWFTLTHRIRHAGDTYRMKKLTPPEIDRAVDSGKRAQPEISTTSHHVHHYLKLLFPLGVSTVPCAPVIDVQAHEMDEAKDKFGIPGGDRRPLIGINAGAEYGPAKRWPLTHFATAIRELHAQSNARFVLFGGLGDLAAAAELTELVRNFGGNEPAPIYEVTGKTSLRELAALSKACHAFISNDSGPAHLAAAVGSTVIIPFGSTSPELTGPGAPGNERHGIIKSSQPCSPCFRRVCPIEYRCLVEIHPETIIKETLTHLHENDELIFE